MKPHFVKEGWIYAIYNTLSPNVFKVGHSMLPILDSSKKPIGRLSQYKSMFPMGEWKVLNAIKVKDAKWEETRLINFLRNDLRFRNVGTSNEWFYGDWNDIVRMRYRFDEIPYVAPKSSADKKKTKRRSEKAKLAIVLSKRNYTEWQKYHIYYKLRLNSISQLESYERRKQSPIF